MIIKTWTSIADIPSSEWNRIVSPGHLICTHEFLSAVEQADVNDCRYFYLVVYDDNTIVAHTCVYFISTELDSFARGPLKRLIAGVRRIWKGFLILRSVECGTPVALGNTISYRTDVDKTSALSLIVPAVEQIARDLGVSVVLFRDFVAEETDFYDSLKNAGYVRIQNLPTSRLTVRWSQFDQYLNSMRSHYRHRLRARMKMFRENGGTLEILSDFSGMSGELTRLWQNAYDHAQEYRREILKPAFFESIHKHLGPSASVLLARVGDSPAGFSLLLDDDDTLIWLFCGLDYKYNDSCAVYFNMLYRIVEIAIDRGYKAVELGITTVVPKMDIGGEVVPLNMYMKDLRPLLSRAVPSLFALMTPQPHFGVRHVFKDESGRGSDKRGQS